MTGLEKLLTINWTKEVIREKVTNDRFLEIYNNLKKNRKEVKLSNNRLDFTKDTYALYRRKTNQDILMIYLLENNKYKCYLTNTYDDNKNKRDIYIGPRAYSLLSSKFKELNNVTMNQAFGATQEEFKRCIPKQLCYFNKKFLNKEILYSSIDACSQYPASICGKLPDARTAVVKEGTIAPTADFPFAFYINSGHCAEYKVFDTHDWINEDQRLWQYLFRMRKTESWTLKQELTDDKDITILMKPSKYELTDVMTYFYNLKEQVSDHESEEYKNAKLVMNAAIGMMHQKKYSTNKYAHLVAICLGRANQKILDTARKIGLNSIAQIVVEYRCLKTLVWCFISRVYKL